MIKDESYYDQQYLLAKYPPADENDKQWFTERVSEYVGRGVNTPKARQQAYLELMDNWSKY